MPADVFIAGGGTGGHVYPALAIADAIVQDGVRKRRTDIHFVGSRRGLEARVVAPAGYSITLLPGRGLSRSLNVKSVEAIGGFLIAFARAFWLLARRRPSVLISVGGYAAAPAAFSAVVLRIPVVIAESNAVPGLVNRILARFAAASAIAWPGTKLPHAVVTGNPVRDAVLEVDRSPLRSAAAKKELGFDEALPLVVVVGGSLGARSINQAVAGVGGLWADDLKASLLHVVGNRDYEDESLRAKSSDSLNVIAVPYQERMELAYAAADVVVCRSGATTIAELAAVGVPSLLIPLPNSPSDHQMANARTLEKAGAAEVLVDSICTAETVLAVLDQLLRNPDRLSAMGRSAKQLARPDAAHGVADVVRSVLAKKGRAYER